MKPVTENGLYIGRKLSREHLKLASYIFYKMKVRLTVQVPIYINMDCTVHCMSIGAQFISGTVANRFSTLRSLGQLHNTEAVEEFSRVAI